MVGRGGLAPPRALIKTEPEMYLRFVVNDLHEESERELGVFHAILKLREAGKLSDYEEEHHDVLRQWFNQNLERPTRFAASKPPHYRKKSRAISWFKDTAVDHISRIRELVSMLEQHGVFVEVLKTEYVGYVVYEDEFQIVAEPFTDRLR